MLGPGTFCRSLCRARRSSPGALSVRARRAVSGPGALCVGAQLFVSGPGALCVGPRSFLSGCVWGPGGSLCRGPALCPALFVSGPGALCRGSLCRGPALCVGARRSLCRGPALCLSGPAASVRSVSGPGGSLCRGPALARRVLCRGPTLCVGAQPSFFVSGPGAASGPDEVSGGVGVCFCQASAVSMSLFVSGPNACRAQPRAAHPFMRPRNSAAPIRPPAPHKAAGHPSRLPPGPHPAPIPLILPRIALRVPSSDPSATPRATDPAPRAPSSHHPSGPARSLFPAKNPKPYCLGE